MLYGLLCATEYRVCIYRLCSFQKSTKISFKQQFSRGLKQKLNTFLVRKYQSYFDHESLKSVENIIQNKTVKKCPQILQNLSKIIHAIAQNIVLNIVQNSTKRFSKKNLKRNEVPVDINTSLELRGQLPTDSSGTLTVKSQAVDRSTLQFLSIFGVILTEMNY